ncbi:MAG: SLBB domain-containing protein [Bacteroidetes bacterium]|nr:SLBB domain-containing protein [Bacteroidota bacterium]
MRTQRFFKGLILLLFVLIATQSIQAQDLLKGTNLSQLKADAISPADIAKLKAQLTSSGMSIDQAEQMAISKGLPAAEAAKLKQKLGNNTSVLTGGAEKQMAVRENSNAESIDNAKDMRPGVAINPLIFGSELYTAAALSFEPNLKLATPVNYILGPDDQIQVSIYGVQEYNGNLAISPEGSVTIPSVGEVKLAGLSIEAATQKLKTVMGNTAYSYLKSGGAKIAVTLSKIRTINIVIIGSVKQGNFKVSSFSSVFNALYIAGGPSAFGSFREIELIRNNKLVQKIDLYKFLLNGDQADNVGLKDNDVIRIPTYQSRIELQGQVKRPGIFEVLPGESISKIISYASGFTDTAYKASLKVFQRNEKERQVLDLAAAQFESYQPKTGDVVVASKILNRFQNRVTIGGAIFRPDVYELSPNLRIADLIRRADGLKEDAFTGRAQIIRLQEDLTRSILSFDVKKALAGDAANNLLLQREDEILISSVLDLRETFTVSIQGEVRKPGSFDYVEKLTLKDLILQAGGFTDAAFKNIEIARLLKRDSIAITDNRTGVIIRTEINGGDLNSSNANIVLQPYDVVTVRRIAGYALPESVTVTGQVQYPGQYSLTNRTERISSLMTRIGGFTQDAYPQGAYIRRIENNYNKERSAKTIARLQTKFKDSSASIVADVVPDFKLIPIDLKSIQKNPGGVEDFVLKAGDELFVPKYDAQVRVGGEVLVATQVTYQSDANLNYYINEAGGFTSNSWKRKVYIVYANGKVSGTTNFLFFRTYPKILPGSELIVPKKIYKEHKGTSTGELMGMASIMASLAGVIIAILKL